jgi:hypothetical protein
MFNYGLIQVKDYNILILDLKTSNIFYRDYVQDIYNNMFYYIYFGLYYMR